MIREATSSPESIKSEIEAEVEIRKKVFCQLLSICSGVYFNIFEWSKPNDKFFTFYRNIYTFSDLACWAGVHRYTSTFFFSPCDVTKLPDDTICVCMSWVVTPLAINKLTPRAGNLNYLNLSAFLALCSKATDAKTIEYSFVWFTWFSSNSLTQVHRTVFKREWECEIFIWFGCKNKTRLCICWNSQMKMDLMMGQAAKGHAQTTRHRIQIQMMIVSSKCLLIKISKKYLFREKVALKIVQKYW
jgi:hypothetical protein